ncbi:BZ3500_MvSof-1268-A1-R1_Chr1-1g00829 [Microbotryum saponariae]|uniref:Vacuolar protein sorting-associated protein 27 n=1 Tax=Microbotryum saponariae TaxID=289078 RepID=A0A2X0L245_9BASI|nr:BZ3500_MvSof-1268-A1-R1_Chr1-1g00829 [Microbotryum saponariae]SCZ92751.1 BZ3501_MvSof-1269-A2-R1_Chr1-1g00426 [Microbotryum saponariae]
MSFLWGPSAGQSEFDTLLEKTTSDLLPSSTPPDLVASLQLADLIRSTAVPASAASKSIFRRLRHPNPNVQLLALSVLDICVKNGGTPFLTAVAGKEFANELESLAKGGSTSSGSNRDVKDKVIAKLQDWATAFVGKEGLKGSELVRVYERMKADGFAFPPTDPTATAAMVESLSAPDWKDAAYCTRCRTDFTTFNRKHHCRNCGDVFDQQCSSNVAPLPHFGITEAVRVCDGCVKKVKEGKGASVLARSTSLGSAQRQADRPGLPERSSTVGHGSSSSSGRRNASARAKEDEDLQRAIAASLLESNPSSSRGPAFESRNKDVPAKSGYTPSYATNETRTSSIPDKTAGVKEEEDPDLAAAIAASLRDVAPAPSAPTFDSHPTPPAATYASLFPNQGYQSTAAPTHATRYAVLPSYDLSPTESSTLHTFTSALAQPPPQLGHRERQLYEQASLAAPRLERGLEDAERRKEMLVEMNLKLAEAARMYQGALENAARAYHAPQRQQVGYGATVGTQQQQQQQYAGAVAQASSAAASMQQTYQDPRYAYQPTPIGQPLPYTIASAPPTHAHAHEQSYAPQPQTYAQPQSHPHPQQSVISPVPAQAPAQAPVQVQAQLQPAGYYKPSQFPSVPSGPQAMLFPHVPQEEPWTKREEQLVEEQKVGELIEL